MLSGVDPDRLPHSKGTRSKTLHSAPAADIRFVVLLCWGIIRLPLAGFLLVLEPVVTTSFVCLAAGGIISSLVFRISGVTPHFPLGEMLAASTACGLVPVLYQRLLRLLSR
jgi:hypothetical protein